MCIIILAIAFHTRTQCAILNRTVFFIFEDVFAANEDSSDDEVANFPDESVNMVYALQNTFQNSVNVKLL